MSTRPEHTDSSRIAINNSELRAERLTLANSTVTFEAGPVGIVARIDRRDGRREYAGPLDETTIAALREVGR